MNTEKTIGGWVVQMSTNIAVFVGDVCVPSLKKKKKIFGAFGGSVNV